MTDTLLIIEDDPTNARMVKALFKPEGWRLLEAAAGKTGLELALADPPDAVVLDLGLPDLPGLEVLRQLRKSHPALPVVVLTGDTEIATAVKALREGAFNYLTKPVATDQLLAVARAALEQSRLKRQVQDLKDQVKAGPGLAERMGPGPSIKKLQDQLRQVSGTLMTVLIQGETGAGKEVVARAIHDQSLRASQPFIALDCGAIPDNLLESELFGHEKGAFSGADKKREGQILLAQGGTLFLDEIGNLPPALQTKLLRVLQERELRLLGGTKAVALDVRIVAATHDDLESQVGSGRFRQDLFFRLAEYRVHIPALRERPEDLPYLCQRFLEEACVDLRRPISRLNQAALEVLKAQPWPGNVRQLRNVVRQAALACEGTEIGETDLPPLTAIRTLKPVNPAGHSILSLKQAGETALARAEREAIQEALMSTGGNILQAARALKADNKTLHSKLKKYGLKAADYRNEER